MDKILVSIKFKPEQYQALKELADEEDVPVSAIVRKATIQRIKELKTKES